MTTPSAFTTPSAMTVTAGDEDATAMAMTMPVMTTQTAMVMPPAVTKMSMTTSPANDVITNYILELRVVSCLLCIIELNKNPKSRNINDNNGKI